METTLGEEKWKWIESQNSKQLLWAVRYLTLRGAQVPDDSQPQGRHAALIHALAGLPNDAGGREFLRLMRAAWRQKKYRQQADGKKPCNFILRTSTQANLKSLAHSKRTTTTAALEELIADALTEDKRHKTEISELKKAHKEQMDALKAKQAKQQISADEKSKSFAIKISDFDKAAKELGAEVCRLLREHCKNTLDAHEEDEEALETIYRDELNTIKERLERATSLGAFNDRAHRHASYAAGTHP